MRANVIYGTHDQHTRLVMYLGLYNTKALKYVYKLRGTGSVDNRWKQHPVAKVPSSVDAWLLVHCPYEWVTDQIRAYYA